MPMLGRPGHPALKFALGLWLSFFLVACDAPVEQADYRELDIDALQALMEKGELTSEQLTQFYLDRIDARGSNLLTSPGTVNACSLLERRCETSRS